MTDDFLDRVRRALAVAWRKPPAGASREALSIPPGRPVAPPDPETPVTPLHPQDVRSAAGEEVPVMISRSLSGVDVAFMITPPSGDGLWTVEGRAWRSGGGEGPIRVVLALGENVAGDETVPSGGRFRFQDLLRSSWSLEFHLGDRTAVLRGPDAG